MCVYVYVHVHVYVHVCMRLCFDTLAAAWFEEDGGGAREVTTADESTKLRTWKNTHKNQRWNKRGEKTKTNTNTHNKNNHMQKYVLFSDWLPYLPCFCYFYFLFIWLVFCCWFYPFYFCGISYIYYSYV